MAEYLLASFLKEVDPEEEIKGPLPLHLTMLHWFESIRGPAEISDAIQPVTFGLGKISTHSTIEDLFGPNNDIPVVRLCRPEALLQLHLDLVDALKPLEVRLDDRWTGEGWKPHVTNTPDNKLGLGDEVEIDKLTIVGRRKGSLSKVIFDTLKF